MIAQNRFGLGARPDRPVSGDADWLLAQLEPAELPMSGLPSTQERVRQQVTLLRRMDDSARRVATREATVEEMEARIQLRVGTERPFFERWVALWSNHFTVSLLRPEVRFLAPVHERTAIRPHVLGRFEDLLVASTLHPAMLLYLDNVASVGPDSRAGRFSGRGLNENLAREVLELHTLGVDGGYGQADVEALAALLTGWSVVGDQRQVSGQAEFVEERHQPGRHTLLGVDYGGHGADDAREALVAIARHPSTARQVARRVARHFCGGEPPELVEALRRSFEDSGGDLTAVATTVVTRPECWEAPAMLRTPDDYVTAIGRALQLEGEGVSLLSGLDRLGQTPFTASSPAGWSEDAADWMSAAAITGRIDVARRAVQRWYDRVDDPESLAERVVALTPETRAAMGGAASRADALALLLVSPEFQRR